METQVNHQSGPKAAPLLDISCIMRRVIRLKRVLEIVPLSRSRVYELIAEGKFPAGFDLVDGGRAKGWYEDQIYAYLEQRATTERGAK